MHLQPYLFFGGRCEEAIEFYRAVLGAEVLALLRYKDNPEPPEPGRLAAGWEEKVMHAHLRIGASTVMASDGCGPEPSGLQGFSLVLTVTEANEGDRLFATLGAGGQVQMPPGQTFFSPRFGMLTDRFGVRWIIYVEG
ncbi:VOC family protein [Methylococcus sp. EFPC2]|uniref:VOC family protein n=1 Tax=Methylococcus sp. EFPC2 TaxID=2812648 RepID=UPI001966EBF0|nr:VOC family protein [Methylococcus sp. EFPC2]QSA97894.1 VOC family protein [Methylococcus sp. EFPC2]